MSVFSDLKVFPLTLDNSSLVAKGSVVMHNSVRFNFSVINGPTGRFVSMPSEKSNKTDEATGKVKYFPIVSVTNEEMKTELNRLVLAELDKDKAPAKSTSAKTSTYSKKTSTVPF